MQETKAQKKQNQKKLKVRMPAQCQQNDYLYNNTTELRQLNIKKDLQNNKIRN